MLLSPRPVRPAAPAASRAGVLRDDALRGILMVVAATLFFSISDATAKFVSQTLPVIEILWVRSVVFLGLMLLPMVRHGRAHVQTRQPVLQGLRGVAIVASSLLFLLGLRVMPMADAAAINFVSPLFITMLSVPLLGERVGPRRWFAVAVGLLGALVAARPGTDALGWAALLPALSAAAWAVGIVLTRRIAVTDAAGATLAWTAIWGFVLLSCLLPFAFRMPSAAELGLCLVVGVSASCGQGMVVLGYRLAPASLLAPFSYLQLIWSTLLGYLVFAGRPGAATIVGAGIVAASGLYSAHRERVRARLHAG